MRFWPQKPEIFSKLLLMGNSKKKEEGNPKNIRNEEKLIKALYVHPNALNELSNLIKSILIKFMLNDFYAKCTI